MTQLPDHVGYCINCRDFRPYRVCKETRRLISVRFNLSPYTEQTAHCVECDSEMYVPEINDENCKARSDAFYEVL